MDVQDDAREKEQRELFRLVKAEDQGRSGIDAILKLEDTTEVLFELKTTTTGSVTTVRDFGFEHIEKWKNIHWLISKYISGGAQMEYSLYGSPLAMSAWIKEKEEYIKPDFDLAKLIPDKISIKHLVAIVGKKHIYTYSDAKKLHKQQLTKIEYEALMDREDGYSPNQMLKILRSRCQYLIERGSTLNNPHIPASYFEGWVRITENHAQQLRKLVTQAIKT